MGNSWKDLFTFSRKEQGGIAVLLIILLALVVLYPLIPHLISEKEYDLKGFHQEVEDFLAELDSLDKAKTEKQKKRWNKDKTNYTEDKLKKFLSEPFTFDPNSESEVKLIKSGLNKFAAKNILAYREKGGSFESLDDLRKIYGMDEEWLKGVSQYIIIESKEVVEEGFDEGSPGDTILTIEDEIDKITYHEEPLIVELNGADSIELQKCTGIGPSYARRIISYRTLLGGFYDKSQLLEVYGMDSARYAGLQHQVTTNPEILRKMSLDTVSFKNLLRHPYFEYYLVKAIFNFMDDQNGLDSIQQLKSMPEIYDELYDKISPYLEVGGGNEK
jgi:DNA uptake protein ComE-like DNA-binding protein